MKRQSALISREQILTSILLIRGQKVMLDVTLAALYRVETRVLVQAVKRNAARFPRDFMFQLTKKEFHGLRSQFVISNGRGGRRTPPFAFTEQGVAMLSSVLRSDRAIDVNVEIMRTFVSLRQMIAERIDLVQRLDELETKYDEQFVIVFDAIRRLIIQPEKPRKRIGFRPAR